MSESLKSLHKKYSDGENVAKFDKLFDEMSDAFLQEQYVPPEPESVVKFYEELYKKFGDKSEDADND